MTSNIEFTPNPTATGYNRLNVVRDGIVIAHAVPKAKKNTGTAGAWVVSNYNLYESLGVRPCRVGKQNGLDAAVAEFLAQLAGFGN